MLPKDPEKLKVKPDVYEASSSDASYLIKLLILVQILMGIICIIGGGLVSPHGESATYIISGILAGLFLFTLAVITAACRKYLDK